jgi:hypothetical protein
MFRRFSEATGLARGSNSSGGEATPGAPLELIRYNQSTTKFELGEEALAVLRKVSDAGPSTGPPIVAIIQLEAIRLSAL